MKEDDLYIIKYTLVTNRGFDLFNNRAILPASPDHTLFWVFPRKSVSEPVRVDFPSTPAQPLKQSQ
jgi:hypothetical protein